MEYTARKHKMSGNVTIFRRAPKTVEYANIVIGDFNHVMKTKKPGKFYKSDEFMVGEVPMLLEVYPTGYKEEQDGHVSVYLCNKGKDDITFSEVVFTVGKHSRQLKPSLLTILAPGNMNGFHTFLTHSACQAELTDGDFDLQVKMEMEGKEIRMQLSEPKTSKKRKSQMLENLYTKMPRSDFSLMFEGEPVRCHKSILMAASPVFEAMVERWTEETSEELHFPGEVGRSLVKFLYTGELEEQVLESQVVSLLHLGEMYDLEGLKERAEDKMIQLLSR